MKRALKLVGGLLVVIVALALGAYAWAMSTASRNYEKRWETHDASFPIPWPLEGAAPESALALAVSRGQHLVDTRVACKGCHGPDLGGGVVINIPIVAYWAAPNLTTGEGGVTRDFTPQDWDRAVRHGVRKGGRSSTMPSEEFRNLSDHELSDIVAYVRSVPPVNRDVGKVKLGPVFAFLFATNPGSSLAFVADHHQPHAAEPPGGESATALGEHIVQVCRGCHGPNLSGGKMQGDPDMPIVANITPHESGLKAWTAADFTRALKEGKRPDGSAISERMPWRIYGQMTDAEIAAMWAYLVTVPPRVKGNH